jgi:hypothetical protein
MSKISLTGNASGTGTFTIASPNSNTDRTLSLPDQTGTLLTNSGAISVNASAPAPSVSIDASGNVGIGTGSPTAKLDVLQVAGGVLAAVSTSARDRRLEVVSDTAGTNFIGLNAREQGSTAARNFDIQTGGISRWRVDTAGEKSSVITGGSTLYPAFDCRAWVNFNGTGTVAIRASGNVTSITDRGTGAYTVNFTTAMPDANYGFAATAGTPGANTGAYAHLANGIAPTTTTVAIDVISDGGTRQDATYVAVSIFR